MGNAAIVADLLLRGLAQVQAYAAALAKSRAEGRDITTDEIVGFKAAYANERADLLAFIEEKEKNK